MTMGNFKIVYEISAAYPCNNCFGALITASKTYSNGTYINMCKSKQNKIIEASLKEQKKRKIKTQHLYIQQANNAKLLKRAIFDCKLSQLLPCSPLRTAGTVEFIVTAVRLWFCTCFAERTLRASALP